jgi:hypothetical protein
VLVAERLMDVREGVGGIATHVGSGETGQLCSEGVVGGVR